MRVFVKIVKKLFKIPACQLLYGSGLLYLFLKLIYARRKNFPVVIIYYHRFTHNPDDQLDNRPSVTHRTSDLIESLRFMKRFFQVISLDEAVARLKQGRPFTRPSVVLTVDDGYRDNYDILFPVLKDEKVTATIFLTTDLIGTNHRVWNEALAEAFLKTKKTELHLPGMFQTENFSIKNRQQKRRVYVKISEHLKDLPSQERESYVRFVEQELDPDYRNKQPVMLSWDQVREMRQAGIAFGAHTATHPILTRLAHEDAREEIARSKNKIEQELQERVKHFAIPNGRREDFNRVLEEDCRKMGFESICTTQFGCNEKSQDRWRLKRISHDLPISLFAINVTRAFLRGSHS